jgi:hypothetical protein
MAKVHENRAALELADAYWRDAMDYVQRYQFTINMEERDNWNIKSRRMKAYIDLRFAIEGALKARICLNTGANVGREDLLRRLRSWGHDISELMKHAGSATEPAMQEALNRCEIAPIHWRYEAEAREARSEDERNYYATVGSDAWMEKLEAFAAQEVKDLNTELQAYSGLVTMADLYDQIFGAEGKKP